MDVIFHAVPDFATTNVHVPSSDMGFPDIVAVNVTFATTYAWLPVTSMNGFGATAPLKPLSFACAANALNAAAPYAGLRIERAQHHAAKAGVANAGIAVTGQRAGGAHKNAGQS